ncbi:hypothetical protein HK102_005166 [Quaeritorhiza haematococci]|nr:hypothetical protein HK102_005166 [Quaeritorhiza haematococci]
MQLSYTSLPLVKPKRNRPAPEQTKVLNLVFQHTFFPQSELRQALAQELEMCPRAIQVWFQNKRQNWKAKHSNGNSGSDSGGGTAGATSANASGGVAISHLMRKDEVSIEQAIAWCKHFYKKKDKGGKKSGFDGTEDVDAGSRSEGGGVGAGVVKKEDDAGGVEKGIGVEGGATVKTERLVEDMQSRKEPQASQPTPSSS